MSFLFRCIQSGTTVVFLTGGCFCLNCASVMLYSGGFIRSKTWMGKALDHGWFFDFIFSMECFINAISDIILLIAVAYCLTGTLKGFILWNTFSVVACWTASCALYYERNREYSGGYPYFVVNETALMSNATNAGLANQTVIPTLALLYISATLIAAFKLVILYAVYFGYLQALTQEAMVNDPFVVFAREQDTSLSSAPCVASSTTCGFYGGAKSPGPTPARPIPSDWGQPSQTSFRPRSEWSSSESRLNPFPENRDQRLSGHQVISSPQPSYPLERWSCQGNVESPYTDPSMRPGASSPALHAPTMPTPPCGTAGPGAPPLGPAPPITGPPEYIPPAPAHTFPSPPPQPPAFPPGAVPPHYQPPAAAPAASQPGPYYTPSSPPQSTPLPPPPPPVVSALAATTAPPTEKAQVASEEPHHRSHKRNRRVSISQSPSVTTFLPTDTAAQVGVDSAREGSQSSSVQSDASVANALARLLGSLTAKSNATH